jgi:hypothetical protein
LEKKVIKTFNIDLHNSKDTNKKHFKQHVESKGQKLNALGTVEIVKAQKRVENLLNEQSDFTCPPF